MADYKYLISKQRKEKITRLNVVDLIKRTKFEENKEKKRNILVTAATISVLAVSGVIISL